ncbi:MAG TPA: PQQ-dependent sugar dehydrogenase [Steroidobacteraceae bacterium]|jgi:hypothetical protein
MTSVRAAIVPSLLLNALSLAIAAPTLAADAAAGKAAFHQQCALCHSAQADDNGGAQGPSLNGIFGRRAASNSSFTYTPALRNSGLTWNAATLERFLAAPTSVVPGSSMVVPVAQKTDRDNIIAYFQSPAVRTAQAATASVAKGEAEWRQEVPGHMHHIKVSDLPAPFATPSARNSAQVIAKPAGAKLAVPPGFKVDVFTTDVRAPRTLRVAPNGDIFVAETSSGRIKVLRASADGAKAASVETYVDGLKQPFGMAFYPAGDRPQWLYVAEVNRILRYPYSVGDVKAKGQPTVVVAQLAPTVGGHTTRDLAFSADGKRLLVSIGSQSNVAEEMAQKSPAAIKTWEAANGLGAAWDNETNRASVFAFNVDSAAPGKAFAHGIRNCVGLTLQPTTGDVWCTTNERDGLGDDLVPDYTTRVQEGGFYGWPWYYLGSNEDPRHKGERPDLKGKVIVPDVLLGAHSAALNLTFYTATSGNSAFPAEYVGDGFAVLHGSWNRSLRTGHKVVRVRMKDNKPTGEYEDFLTGFIIDDGSAWGRPVAAAVAKDGSLLVSDDGGSVIYRVSYSK